MSLDNISSSNTPTLAGTDSSPGPGPFSTPQRLYRFRDRVQLGRIRDKKHWTLSDYWLWFKVKENNVEESIGASFRLRYRHRKLVLVATWLPRIVMTLLLLVLAALTRVILEASDDTVDGTSRRNSLRADMTLRVLCGISLSLDLFEICLLINFRLHPYILLTTNILKITLWTFYVVHFIKGLSSLTIADIPATIASAILFLTTLVSFIYALHISYRRYRDRKTCQYARNGAKYVNWPALRAQLQRQIDPDWVNPVSQQAVASSDVSQPPKPDSDVSEPFDPDNDDLDAPWIDGEGRCAPGVDSNVLVSPGSFSNSDEIV